MATRANLHGKPLATVREVARRIDGGPKEGQSRRAWGKELAKLVHELAMTNVEPGHFASYVPGWMVTAIGRERTNLHLANCGVRTLPLAA